MGKPEEGTQLLKETAENDQSKQGRVDSIIGSVVPARLRTSAALVFAVFLFMICQTSMLLCNKAVLRTWSLPITVTMIQMAFASATVFAMPWTWRVGSWADARRWALWIPALFAISLSTSMLALRYSTAGAVVVMRNVAPIFSLAAEALTKEKVPVDRWTVLALVYTLIGVLLYLAADVSFSTIGVICIIINMIAVVLQNITTRRLLAVEPVDLSKMTIVLINNTVALPLVSLLLVPTHEVHDWPTLKEGVWGSYVILLLSCVVGVAIGWTAINVQSKLTATSYLVVGNLNKFIVIGAGMLFMGESHSWQSILGCVIAVSGGLLYAIARKSLSDKADTSKAAAVHAAASSPPPAHN